MIEQVVLCRLCLNTCGEDYIIIIVIAGHPSMSINYVFKFIYLNWFLICFFGTCEELSHQTSSG